MNPEALSQQEQASGGGDAADAADAGSGEPAYASRPADNLSTTPGLPSLGTHKGRQPSDAPGEAGCSP